MPKTKDWSGYETPSDGDDGKAGANGCLIYNNSLGNALKKPLMAALDEVKMISSPPKQPYDAYSDEERHWVPATIPSCVPHPKSTVAPQSPPWLEVLRQEPAATEQLLPPSPSPHEQLPAHINLSPRLAGQDSSQSSILGHNTSERFLHTQVLEGSLSSSRMAPVLYSQSDVNSQAPLSMPNFDPTSIMDNAPLPIQGEPAVDTAGSDHPNPNPALNSNSIPLKCCLCPKKPNFSDVSHLLTHIASKSHLAARFKLEISDKAEDKNTIQLFKEWADQYGITQLLKNRQDAKEKKRQTQLKRQRASGNEQKKPRRSSVAQEQVKLESGQSTPLGLAQNPLNPLAWPYHVHVDGTFDSSYQTPVDKRASSVYLQSQTPQQSEYFHNERASEEGEEYSRSPKLKGAVWPGMRIFDAATPEMRRMRNQKKDHSVLANMVTTSKSVEQIEYVWDEGMFKVDRTRNVYDSPSVDGSPIKDEKEVPPPKKHRGKAAATAAPEGPRKTRSATKALRSGKRVVKREEVKPEDIVSDDDVQDTKDGRALTVFDDGSRDLARVNDNSAAGRQVVQDMIDNPFSDHHATLPQRSAMQNLPANRPMSSLFSRHDNPSPFTLFDKENERNPYGLHQASNLPTFLGQRRQNGTSDGLNPLCVQRQDNLSNLWGDFDVAQPANAPYPTMTLLDYGALNMAYGLNNGMNNGPSYQAGNIPGPNHEFSV